MHLIAFKMAVVDEVEKLSGRCKEKLKEPVIVEHFYILGHIIVGLSLYLKFMSGGVEGRLFNIAMYTAIITMSIPFLPDAISHSYRWVSRYITTKRQVAIISTLLSFLFCLSMSMTDIAINEIVGVDPKEFKESILYIAFMYTSVSIFALLTILLFGAYTLIYSSISLFGLSYVAKAFFYGNAEEHKDVYTVNDRAMMFLLPRALPVLCLLLICCTTMGKIEGNKELAYTYFGEVIVWADYSEKHNCKNIDPAHFIKKLDGNKVSIAVVGEKIEFLPPVECEY